MRVHFFGFDGIEVVAVPLAPLLIPLGKGFQAMLPHAIGVPEGENEINPLLRTVPANGAFKDFPDSGEYLLCQGNQIIVGGSFLLGSNKSAQLSSA